MLRLSRTALSFLAHGPGSGSAGVVAVASGVHMVHSGRGVSVVSATPQEKEVETDFDAGGEDGGEFRSTFKASELQVIRSHDHRPAPSSWENIKFGRDFTPHLFSIKYTQKNGWETPYLKPFENVSIHPASQVLHYGNGCFEGMKAYAAADGTMRLFRPELNLKRLITSTTRLTNPAFEPEELLKCIEALVRLDQDWLPKLPGHSLYIRPNIYGTGSFIGLAPATDCEITVIMSPVGPYFSSGFTPVNIFLDQEFCRAPHGGTGQFKVGGNYAPTIQTIQTLKSKHNCSQVLYTTPDRSESKNTRVIAECAAMNMFFLLEHGGERELVTPPLNGTILPGITRDSILELCRQWGEFRVSEREMSVEELCDHAKNGNMVEVFGTGTACVVQPVLKLVKKNGQVLETNNDKPESEWLAQRIFNALEEIQYGHVEHPWSHRVQ